MPIVVFAEGTKVVSNVASVEMNVAHAKLFSSGEEPDVYREIATHLIPVVTATWPSRLNQPVIHDAKAACSGLQSMAAQK